MEQSKAELYRVYWVEPNTTADGTVPHTGNMALPLGYTDAKVYRNLSAKEVGEVKSKRGKNTLISVYPEREKYYKNRYAVPDYREQWVKELDKQFEIQ